MTIVLTINFSDHTHYLIKRPKRPQRKLFNPHYLNISIYPHHTLSQHNVRKMSHQLLDSHSHNMECSSTQIIQLSHSHKRWKLALITKSLPISHQHIHTHYYLQWCMRWKLAPITKSLPISHQHIHTHILTTTHALKICPHHKITPN